MADDTAGRVNRASHLRWVRLGDMKISPKAQASYSRPRAERIAANFDPELLGFLVVSFRDGHYYVIDGQHRRAGFVIWHGEGWEDQKLQCEVYEGLTEQEEAETFLGRNDKRNPTAFDKFMVALTAGRDRECDICRIVLAAGLKIGHDNSDKSTAAVGALGTVYDRAGELTLACTVRIARDAFAGDPKGLGPNIIRGLGLVCQRYNGQIDDADAVARLSAKTAHRLSQSAAVNKERMGRASDECMAAAIIDAINTGKRGRGLLPSWWS